MSVFVDWRDLPPEVKVHLDALEQFVGDVDGKTIIEDDGTIDAEDAVKAVNGLVAIFRASASVAIKPPARPSIADMIRGTTRPLD